MENQQQEQNQISNPIVSDKPSKIIKMVIVGVLILFISAGLISGLLYFKFGKDTSGFLATSLQSNSDTTGAVSQTPPPDESKSYEELYSLIDKGDVNLENFSIHPIPQERRIEIIIKKPISDNIIKAKKWLDENGYSNISPSKITYIEEK